jgi:hypothetical protein
MIKIFTLNSGDDIIAEMLDEDDDQIILKDPLTIKYAISMKGGMYIQLKLYGIFSADEIFSFKKSLIISSCYPKENMVDYYKLSVETAKEEFIPDVDAMVDQHISSLKSYQMDKQLAEQNDAAFTDFLQKVTIKTMQ